jgi:hypothetical protein
MNVYEMCRPYGTYRLFIGSFDQCFVPRDVAALRDELCLRFERSSFLMLYFGNYFLSAVIIIFKREI